MTVVALAGIALGAIALVLYFTAEAMFDAVFGYLGAGVIWVVSLGRIRVHPFDASSEAAAAPVIGVCFAVALVVAICYVVQS
jgi:hypothetical protein